MAIPLAQLYPLKLIGQSSASHSTQNKSLRMLFSSQPISWLIVYRTGETKPRSTLSLRRKVAPPQNADIEKKSILGVFAPQGRHNEPILVKYCTKEYTTGLLSYAKFDPDRRIKW